MKILHIAPINTAGVPIEFVRAERALGHQSRLITLARNPLGYQEDICLNLPFLDFWGIRVAKRFLSSKERLRVDTKTNIPSEIPRKWTPNNQLERFLVALRERIWKRKIDQCIQTLDLFNFDLYQLDGGLEFYRDGRFVRELKRRGKKIICCYTGSDLRVRGVIPQIDQLSDLNVTVEFDHQWLHPNIHHVFFPFNPWRFDLVRERKGGRVRIGHAPTNRKAKGSDIIISAIKELKKEYPVELVLIENLPYEEALKLKATCHIFVDQIGELGYGINSLESLSMGIATCSSLANGFEERYPDHPFILINEKNLKQKLIELVENPDLRREKGLEGRRWVEEHHDSRRVVRRIHQLAGIGS